MVHMHLKGWLAIAKLKPLSLFIPLFQHCQMLSKALIIEKWKVKVILALQWLASPLSGIKDNITVTIKITVMMITTRAGVAPENLFHHQLSGVE